MDAEFVTIARIVKAQGRIGEVAAELHTDFPDRFAQRTRLYLLAPAGTRREVRLEEHWGHKGGIVLKFQGVDSISDAEQLVGCEVQIPGSERAELEADEVYVSDLVGSMVSDNGRDIGTVADVTFGAGEAPLLIVRNGAKEFMIPFATSYIKRQDIAAKRLDMQLPEGMLELDAPLSKEEKQAQQQPAGDDDEV